MALIELMAQAGMFGGGIEHLVLLFRSFQLFLSFVFRLLVLFHSLRPSSHKSSHSILDVTFRMWARTVLSTMQHLLLLRHSCLLAKHTVALGTVVLMQILLGYFVVAQDTGPCLLSPRNPDRFLAVRYRGRSSRG